MNESQQPDPQNDAARPNNGSQPAVSNSFEFNGPTIISLLYLCSFFVGGVTGIVGVVLAYVWQGETRPEWEKTHFTYLIRTFWIGFVGSIIGVILLIVAVGFIVLLGVAVLIVIRSILSLINAQKQEPMPNPESWWV